MRIAFIGLGSIAQKHIAAIKKIDANAALFAVSMLASAGDENLAQKLDDFRQAQSDKVKASELSPPTQG